MSVRLHFSCVVVPVMTCEAINACAQHANLKLVPVDPMFAVQLEVVDRIYTFLVHPRNG